MKYQQITNSNIEEIKKFCQIPSEAFNQIKLMSTFVPFKTNNYIVSQLIDWLNYKTDGVYKINFPQKHYFTSQIQTGLKKLKNSTDLLVQLKETISIKNLFLEKISEIPNDVPSTLPNGLFQQLPSTMLLFPAEANYCFGFCAYCFRWGFHYVKHTCRYSDPLLPVNQLINNPDISDVIITGGDAFFMNASELKKYILPLLNIETLRTIRFSTKALSWWPYRFVEDDDTEELFQLFKLIKLSGKNCTIMAHISHPKEISTPVVQKAISNIIAAGILIRSQTPILKEVNDNPATLKELLNKEVELGIVPYYIYLESSIGFTDYFKIPIIKAFEICRETMSTITGLARTIRCPVSNTCAKKILIDGIIEDDGKKRMVLKCIQSSDPSEVGMIKLKDIDEKSYNVNWD